MHSKLLAKLSFSYTHFSYSVGRNTGEILRLVHHSTDLIVVINFRVTNFHG